MLCLQAERRAKKSGSAAPGSDASVTRAQEGEEGEYEESKRELDQELKEKAVGTWGHCTKHPRPSSQWKSLCAFMGAVLRFV